MISDTINEKAGRIDDVYLFPSSVSQNRFWSLDQLQPGNPSLNLAFAMRIQGALHFETLCDSLNDIVQRHEALRTTFVIHEGRLMQVVSRQSTVDLTTIALYDIPKPNREQKALEIRLEEAQRPFSLTRGPLFRVNLLQMDKDDSVLLLTLHHIICDGWSSGIIVRELGAVYAAFCAGDPSPLPELPLQYADFAAWQQEWLATEGLLEQQRYWKNQLSGTLPVLDMPTDRLRQGHRGCPGDTETLLLPEGLTTLLREVSLREGATMFMLLLAVYKALLHRYTGNKEILVGFPTANRQTVELEQIVGLFSNPVLLLTDISGNPTFRELLSRIREVVLGAFNHQDMPFEKVVETLDLGDGRSQSPLIQAYFIYQKAFLQPLDFPGSHWTPLRSVTPGAIFDITLSCLERPEGLRLQLEYRTDLFERATIVRLLGHFRTMLESIVVDPAQRISDLPMLRADERKFVIAEPKDQTISHDPVKLVHELVQIQAEREPNAVAVQLGANALTYGELDARSTATADDMQSVGVMQGAIVGIFMSSSPEQVVAAIAVLKAGATFVVIDAANPRLMCEKMAADVPLSLVLTTESLLPQVPFSAEHVLAIGKDCTILEKRASLASGRSPVQNGVACIVFSQHFNNGVNSKVNCDALGVLIDHQVLAERSLSLIDEYGISSTDRCLLFGSTGYATSLDVLFPALVAGATVVLWPGDSQHPDVSFMDYVRRERCSVINLPAEFLMGATEPELDGCDIETVDLRLVVIGGEYAHTGTSSTVRNRFKHCRCLVRYGKAETVGAIAHLELRVATDRDDKNASVTLGLPIAGARLYVLDSNLQPLPTGIPGELYIGGDGLAAGYLNNAEAEERAYVEDPFRTGYRLFKTGDAARMRSDGGIEFLGGMGRQLKISGCRIDFNAIETALLSHSMVRACFVSSYQYGAENRRLVAFVQFAPKLAATNSELRAYLIERLPVFMVPSVFVPIPAIPLTPDGVTDISGFPIPVTISVAEKTDTDSVEDTLTEIFCKILNRETVGIYDNFFELGGHSLLAVRLFAEIECTFGKRMPLAILFQAATIKQMAELLRPQTRQTTWPALVPIQPNGSRVPIFCMHRDDGLVMCYRELAYCLGQNQPVYGLQAQGLSGEDNLYTSVEAMAEHYVDEIRTICPDGPYMLVGSSFGGIVAYEVAKQLQTKGLKIGLLALVDSFAPIALRDRLFEKPAVERAQVHVSTLKSLGLGGKLQYIAKKVKKRVGGAMGKNGTDIDGDIAGYIPETLLKLRQVNLAAYRNYEPGCYSGTICLFRAAERNYFANYDPKLWWGTVLESCAEATMEIWDLPSNHLDIMKPPHVIVFADQLSALIENTIS